MPEMHLRFTFSACGSFTKTKKEYKNSKQWETYRNELDKACFKHDMVCGDFEELPR